MKDVPDLTGEELISSLRNPELKTSACHNANLDKIIQSVKVKAAAQDNQPETTLAWIAQTIAAIQSGFIAAFDLLRKNEFYDAWCQLEQCENSLLALHRHHVISSDDPHRLEYIEMMIERWQSLYPYKVFFSPEILKKKVVCSVCGATVSARSDCGHKKWGIYNGEMCYHKVVELEFLSISMVENPVQRYSVAFAVDEESGKSKDHYNYGNVRFVVERLDSAFHGWESHKTTRVIKKTDVAHLVPDDSCPCLSGKKFGDCCYNMDEFTVPHLQFNLYVPPSKCLPENELLF